MTWQQFPIGEIISDAGTVGHTTLRCSVIFFFPHRNKLIEVGVLALLELLMKELRLS
jgi:hypothetical protein